MNVLSRPRPALLGMMLLIVTGAAILRAFPPTLYDFYPHCPVHGLTGWECPGCGSTRALAALLAGNWAAAIQYNALIVALVPAALALFFIQTWSALRWNRWRQVDFPARSMTALLIVSLVFGITRNLVP